MVGSRCYTVCPPVIYPTGHDPYYESSYFTLERELHGGEMVLLEESIHAIKMGYNQRFLALRELKRRIIQNIKDDNYRMREIDSELGNEGKKYWEPELLKSEWPEGRMERCRWQFGCQVLCTWVPIGRRMHANLLKG